VLSNVKVVPDSVRYEDEKPETKVKERAPQSVKPSPEFKLLAESFQNVSTCVTAVTDNADVVIVVTDGIGVIELLLANRQGSVIVTATV
jgi:hypothetical protein